MCVTSYEVGESFHMCVTSYEVRKSFHMCVTSYEVGESFHVQHVTANQPGQNIPSKGCVMVTIKGNHLFKDVNEALSEWKTHMVDLP